MTKDFYKELVDNLHDGVYFVDRKRVITYWNKGVERLTGYSAAEMIGRRCPDSKLNYITAKVSIFAATPAHWQPVWRMVGCGEPRPLSSMHMVIA